MTLAILTAVTDAEWEADLVAELASSDHGATVVRRCVDVAELLSVAATRTADAVVLSPDLRRLDAEALGRLAAAGVAVVGLVERGDDAGERRLRQLGVSDVLPADTGLPAVVAALHDAVRSIRTAAPGPLSGERSEVGSRDTDHREPPMPTRRGRVVAVWGPHGAPGRTTVAVGIADEASRLGVPTILVDADSYGGCVGQLLGFLDEAPGLAAAARLAATGRLDVSALAGLARMLHSSLRVLTGITRPDRWTEMPHESVRTVLDLSRRLARLVVVDCGFSLEQDEELVYDTMAPRRNGATIAAIEAADLVLAVGAADPVGLHRLVRGLADLRALVPTTQIDVALNKLRRGITPGDPASEVTNALRRHTGFTDPVLLPYERTALDRALGQGRTLAEVAPGAPLRRALVGVAAALPGVPARTGSGRG